MIGLGAGALKIFVALEPQDMRKSFQGLSELALEHLGEQLSREALFVITNKRRTRIKLLYFDALLHSQPPARGREKKIRSLYGPAIPQR